MPDDPLKPPINCPACGCRDLFVRKDFPQKVGLAIVLIAGVAFIALAAARTYFYLGALVLLGAVLVDAIIYLFVGQVIVCYRCRAEIRDRPIDPSIGAFDLSTAEKYRG